MENLENDMISVIIPIYNVEKYLKDCLKSVSNQQYKNLEIILVDDGSTDKSGMICDTYKNEDERIKVIHKKNGGVSSARNAGLQVAKGRWIAFIDSDDWVEETYFKIMIEKAKEEKADIVCCGYNRVTNDDMEQINICENNEEYNSNQYLIMSLNPQSGFGFCHMKLIKRSIINDIRFCEDLAVGEDALFNIQLSKNVKKAIFLKQALYYYRNNADSAVKKFDVNYVEKYLKSLIKNGEYILANYDSDIIRQNYYNFIAYHMLLIAVNYCYHPDNPNKNKNKMLKDISNYEVFKRGIKMSNYKNISLTRKITLFTLKHGLYFLTGLICKIRQKQNRRNK